MTSECVDLFKVLDKPNKSCRDDVEIKNVPILFCLQREICLYTRIIFEYQLITTVNHVLKVTQNGVAHNQLEITPSRGPWGEPTQYFFHE